MSEPCGAVNTPLLLAVAALVSAMLPVNTPVLVPVSVSKTCSESPLELVTVTATVS